MAGIQTRYRPPQSNIELRGNLEKRILDAKIKKIPKICTNSSR
jgi:hypothetical protein